MKQAAMVRGAIDGTILRNDGFNFLNIANDDVAQSAIDVFFDGVEVSNATTQLNWDFISHRFEDGFDGRKILRFARKGTIEVDQVQASCAFVEPALGHGRGVFAKRSGLVHVALFEANTMAVFEINCRYQNHG
jgi:hypothetical protein